MLVIRREQMAALAPPIDPTFAAWMLEHLRANFARQLGGTSDTELTALIERGYRRSCGYGIATSAGHCKFIDLTVVFGEDFDENPEYPWAGRTLRDPSVRNPDQTIEIVARLAKWKA